MRSDLVRKTNIQQVLFRSASVKVFLFLTLFISFIPLKIFAQNLPIGRWEFSPSYASGQHLVQTPKRIFCSSYNGFFSISTNGSDIKTYDKSDGLSEIGISAMAYDAFSNSLLVAYRSGNVDQILLDENSDLEEVRNWSLFLRSADLPESIKINKIQFQDNQAYFTSNFGILLVDVVKQEVIEAYRYIGSNGVQIGVTDLAFTSDSIYAVTDQGLKSCSLSPTINKQYFANWKTIETPGKIVALTTNSEKRLYAGISGKGIYVRNGKVWSLIVPSTSQSYFLQPHNNEILATLNKSLVSIANDDQTSFLENTQFATLQEAVKSLNGRWWCTDRQNGLLSNVKGEFTVYIPPTTDTTVNSRTDSLILDLNGVQWIKLPISSGGGILVKDSQGNAQKYLNTAPGNGGLPSNQINSIALDKDGYVWFASNNGVGYFIPDDIIRSNSVHAILPIYGQRKLLVNEQCTSIAIDAGNKKWIGARNGLFQFNEDGTELIHHFTIKNSPLPSNQIKALQYNASSGLLSIETSTGLIKYQTASSQPSEDFSQVTIYPNPVRPEYSGSVALKGLMDHSTVKILQPSGRLVFETKSEGGVASWNLNDYKGNRVQGGIYLILVISSDGQEQYSGKLAIIR